MSFTTESVYKFIYIFANIFHHEPLSANKIKMITQDKDDIDVIQ